MASELKRLPTGIQTFSEIREGNYIYVDKTALVYRLTHDHKYLFMSRPRRFGKSVLCSTLKNSYTQSGLRLHKVGISFSTEERTLNEWEIV